LVTSLASPLLEQVSARIITFIQRLSGKVIFCFVNHYFCQLFMKMK